MTDVRRISGLVPSVICHLSFAICHLPSATRNPMLYRGAHHDVPWGRRRLDRPRGVFKSRRQVKMGFVIRPFRETDRAAVIAFTVAAFPGVSIDHNVDERLGAVAGRDWQWRKGRDVERDIDSPGTEL